MMQKWKILKIKISVHNFTNYNKFTNNVVDAKKTEKKLVNESVLNEKIKTWAAKEKNLRIATNA